MALQTVACGHLVSSSCIFFKDLITQKSVKSTLLVLECPPVCLLAADGGVSGKTVFQQHVLIVLSPVISVWSDVFFVVFVLEQSTSTPKTVPKYSMHLLTWLVLVFFFFNATFYLCSLCFLLRCNSITCHLNYKLLKNLHKKHVKSSLKKIELY